MEGRGKKEEGRSVDDSETLITGGFTSIFSGAMPFATRRDFMNSEMTTSFLNFAIAAIRRFWSNTRLSAGFQLRQSGAQKMHGHSPPAREQLRRSGV